MHYSCDINVVSMFTCSRHDPILAMHKNSSTGRWYTEGPGLAALPWVPSLIPGGFRQISFPALLGVLCSCCCRRSTGTWKWSQRRWDLLGDAPIRLLWTGASPGQLSCTGRTFPSGVSHHCAHHSPGKAPVAPISTGTCSAGHRCPWQE